ncbi:MAG: phosphoribosylglycinamide formyltransferase [Oscillospiraceae bacterium]|nr:phosphoribosylglycinamide formyltransferase [Oscillospiraceae bacterium]MBQ1755121.1 phosphoribosylglycinamide formyltransferase [Oscillospiraceae bacterium]MBQ2144528.1 phosphoribosylglycinamide formyltransferase [Oscillospiraceae bacterium]MBQ6281900.1 phosphoribosylglycinamide formyltransferase [Oscillospiraceae bacterium]MBQ9373761.1 phosphoribosylglycinamide formyltransferase [Oscillospiraceae bacterium]
MLNRNKEDVTEPKIRVAVLVSGGGTNLQAILDAAHSGMIRSAEVVLVISSQPGVYALERAKRAGVPSAVLRKQELGGQAGFETALLELLRAYRVDLIVLAGFLSILSNDFTSQYDHRILNVHPSLIPSFCGKGFYGLKVHEAALSRGVKVTGATVHFVNEIPDGGEILAQKAVEILPDDTPETLQRRVMEQAEWKLLPAAVESVSAQMLENRKDR